MATLARRLRLGVTSLFMLSGLVGMLCESGFGQTPFVPIPPVVKFTNGQYTGTLQTQGMTLPITGTLEYLSGTSPRTKLDVLGTTGGQQITSDSWVTSTPTVISEWASTNPTTCGKEVLSGGSYPQCTAWNQTGNAWSLECTVNVQGNQTTLDVSAVVNSGNQLLQLQENTTGDMTDSFTIVMTSQSTTPPPISDFDLPGICTNGNNQGENGQCTGTIPSICLP